MTVQWQMITEGKPKRSAGQFERGARYVGYIVLFLAAVALLAPFLAPLLK
jgi:hypothetical protein